MTATAGDPPEQQPTSLVFDGWKSGRLSTSGTNSTSGAYNSWNSSPSSASLSTLPSMPPTITPQQLAVQGYAVFKAQQTTQQTTEYLNEERHRQPFAPIRAPYENVPITWRLKERMKTVSVALVLCLNIGTDPPDVVKVTPCARVECWFDPRTTSKTKAIETIGNNLQQQYERWQARAKYKQALDPTMEDVKKLCASLRRNAKTDRLLFHYNGHGVPRPTSAGEIWVFNKTYTQYIPLSIYDLRAWVGMPSIYVLDCSGAGILLPHFLQTPVMPASSSSSSASRGGTAGGLDGPPNAPSSSSTGVGGASSSSSSSTTSHQRDCIVLAPCAANELLPTNAKFPADLFTACLTTPILIALRWFIVQNPLSMGDVDVGFVDHIPGKLNDRKTPLGELNWIFTAITDTIAWNTLPSPVFQRLFRQDLLVASLFRNFLLADRILRSFNCTPTSIPRLVSTAQHPLWQAWDLAAESCLSQLLGDRNPTFPSMGSSEARLVSSVTSVPGMLSSTSSSSSFSSPSPSGPASSSSAANNTSLSSTGTCSSTTTVSSIPFFADQLTAFEVWLEFTTASPTGAPPPKSPEQLPVVLQVLLSQAHRLRALLLLRRFLDLGPWAVNLALSVGIFPYVLKLLQSPAPELRQVLVCTWARILAFDPSCRSDLVKDNAYLYFIGHLGRGEVEPEQRVLAAFVMSVIMDDSRSGQRDCLKKGVHKTFAQFLFARETEGMPMFRRWLCFCLGKLAFDHVEGKNACLREDVHLQLFGLLSSPWVEVRAAAIYALGTMLGSGGGNPGGGGGKEGGGGAHGGGERHTSSNSLSSLSSPRAEGGFGGGTSPGGGMGGRAGMRAASIDLEATRRVDVSVIGLHLLKAFEDASPVVRREAILALYLLVTDSTHFPYFVWVAHELTRHNLRLQQQQKHKEEGGREEVGGGGGGVNGEMAMSKSMESLASSEAASSSTSSMVGLMVEEDDEDEGGREERSVSLPLPNGNWNEKQKNKPAGEDAEGGEEGEEEWDRIPWYRGLSARLKKKGGEIAEHYLFLWLAIRQVHQKEPFPPAADVAGHLVHLVHERLLDMALDPSKTVPFPGPPAARPLRPTASAVILSPLQQQQQQQCLNQQQCQQQQLHQRQPRDLDAALSPPTRHSSSSSSSSSMAPPSTLHSSRVALRPFNSSGLPPRSPSSSTNLAAQAVQQQQPLPHQGGVGGPPSLPASPHPPPPPPSGVSRLPIERAVSAQELARPSQPHSHPSPSPQGLPRGGPAGSVPTAATTASVASTRNTLMPYGGTNHHQATHTNTSSSSSNNSSNSSSQGGRQGGMVSASGHRPTSTTGTSILQSAHGAPRNGLLSGALPGGGGGGMREKGSVFSSSSNAMNTNQTRVDRNPYVAISGGHPLARHQSLVAPDETTALGQASAARLMVSSFSTAAVADSPSVQWLRTQYHETNIYAWSKRHLSTPAALSPAAGEEGEEDPLSPEGQLNLYRKTRNRRVLQEAEALSLKCASVLGMPEEDENPDFLFMLDGIDALLSSQKAAGGGVGGKKWASTSSGGAAPKRKNQVLRLQQKAVFESDAEMTSQLLFHPFEPILVSSDDHSNVRVWNYEEGKKLGGFKNETAPNKASRVSSVTWLNEASSSLLLTGSEDGVVRVWDGVVPTGSRWTSPRLTTSFYVHALVGRGAGLVTKWVHGAGLLLTGGSSDQLRAWDLQREQMVREWETGGEACVTCLAATTPLQPPTGSTGGRGGIGGHSTPSSPLVVAGFGDGKAKIWDVRMDKCVGVLTEHQHWLVLTDFVKGDRELLTGSLTGEVKFWDLRRLKAPLRTVDVGKGPMTAMAAHHTCPLMASGSYNQFIKVLTLEGDTLSVIRYHDGILGQRIGPVATLTFHPCKLLLAAGAADSLISIYSAHFPQAS